MSDMKATSLGPCGACSRPIYQMTPTAHVYRGIPKRAYLAHKDCADKENEPLPTEAVMVSTPAQIAPEAIVSSEEVAISAPSMPVKEQTGRRRGRPPGSKNKPR